MTGNPISLHFSDVVRQQHIILRTNEYYIIYHVRDMYSIFLKHTFYFSTCVCSNYALYPI